MVLSSAVFGDSFAVFGGGITFVLLPMVLRELQGKVFHIGIAVGFRKYRSCRDGLYFAVAFHHTSIRNFLVRYKLIAVYRNKFGGRGELSNSAVHSRDRSAEDIQLVYFGREYVTNSISYHLALDDRSQEVALRDRKSVV